MLQNSRKRGKGEVKEAVETMSVQRAAIEEKMTRLEQQGREIDAEERRVEDEAARLEAQIRLLAEEEVRLQERKRDLRQQAQGIGEQRKSIQDRRKVVQAEVLEVQAQARALEAQQAREEAQKRATVQVAPPPPAASREGNRRRNPRIAVAVDVSMHTEHNFYAGITRDLSAGGLFIATMENLPVGTEMDLRMSLPERQPIQARGRVCWVREHNQFNQDFLPGVGVAFMSLQEEDRRAIEHFIRTREPLLHGPDVL